MSRTRPHQVWVNDSEKALLTHIKKHGVVTEEYQHTSDYKSRDLVSKNKDLSKQVHQQLDRIKELEAMPEILQTMAHIAAAPVAKINHHAPSGGSESVAVLALSDLHVEEIVKPETVNNLNEYTPKIAKKRLEKVFDKFVYLVGIQQKATKVDDVVLFLGGDLISGYIHDELKENNAMSPTSAVAWLIPVLQAGIQHIKDNLKPKSISVVCVSGNHGRTTPKPQVSTREENSFEGLLYTFMGSVYKEDPVVDFIIAGGYHLYVEIWPNYTVRFHHGDAFKGGGGVGGISIPINKLIDRWNRAKHADLDIFGHFHQSIDHGHWIANGSLIGWNPFAIKIGGRFEKPAQTAVLIEKNKGKTFVMRLLAE